MKCRKPESWLARYALGLLSDRQAERARSHLARCGDCAAALAKLEKSARRLQREWEAAPPPGLPERVLAKAGDLRPPASPVLRWLPAAAAAAVLAAVLAWPLLFRNSPHMTTQEVVNSYSEDMESLGLVGNEANRSPELFDYGIFGIPEEVSRFMI